MWLAVVIGFLGLIVIWKVALDFRAIKRPSWHIDKLIATKALGEVMRYVPPIPKFDPVPDELQDTDIAEKRITFQRSIYDEFLVCKNAIESECERVKQELEQMEREYAEGFRRSSAGVQ